MKIDFGKYNYFRRNRSYAITSPKKWLYKYIDTVNSIDLKYIQYIYLYYVYSAKFLVCSISKNKRLLNKMVKQYQKTEKDRQLPYITLIRQSVWPRHQP